MNNSDKKLKVKRKMKNRIFKISTAMLFITLFVMSSYSLANIKGSITETEPLIADRIYTASNYIEGINLHPMRSNAIGVNMELIGGSVNLPFDLTTYNNLLGFQLVISNQRLWRDHAQRRFWDVSDGATMLLVFRGLTLDDAKEDAREIKLMMETLYGLSLHLVFGEWDNGDRLAVFVFQGHVSVGAYELFIDEFVSYVPNAGFGKGLTSSVLVNSPVKAMGIGLLHERFPIPGIGITTEWIPILSAAWIDPDGLIKDGTQVDMNLTNIMPSIGPIEGAAYATASVVTMKLPYVVDVLEIDPRTDNMYPHLKGYFEWVVKVNLPLLNWSLERSYDDIYVKYDFNLTDMQNYPQVIGEMSLDSTLPIDGSEDLVCSFTFENVDDTEPAYDIELAYGEFKNKDLDGFTALVNNPELTFNDAKEMYYNATSQILTDTVIPLGPPEIVKITGWFWNSTGTADWLRNNQIVLPEEFDNPEQFIYVEKEFLQLDEMDFTLENLTDANGTLTGYSTLKTTIPVLNPGENVTKKFAMRDLPTGNFNEYVAIENTTNDFSIILNATHSWEDLFIIMMQLFGSSLHIPEDQVTWTNWFPEPVIGSAFVYKDGDDKEYMGMTNGLVLQVYDDEAILVGKVSLDKDVYRFGDNTTFTLELTNIGNANATNVNYSFYHAFVTDDLELAYIEEIEDSDGVISIIEPLETVTRNYTVPARTHIGLHPVFAMFNYTTDEADDPTYDIFSACDHPAVLSSMDFGIVLPPLNKEQNQEPTYPTPEVEVTMDIIGYEENVTEIGDELLIRYTITNIGDEDTNIIFIQRFPIDEVSGTILLRPVNDADEVNVTVDGVPFTDYDIIWDPNNEPNDIGMPVAALADEIINWRGAHGIPLAVDETMVIEFAVEVNTAGEIYLPPAEIRYRSEYEIPETNAVNEERSTDTETAGSPAGLIAACDLPEEIASVLTPQVDQEDFAGQSSTNSWGSYSESLSLAIAELAGTGLNFLYIGIGVIAVTGVAILIYFTANGKRK